ncbi:MAG: hypothetical protein WC758_08085 [Candidatus Woesearchaeota archaeon]|jgi:hypothetical protein
MKIFYKVISKDNKAIHGGNFDYTDYLPKGNKKGKWLPLIKEVSECNSGYHITNYWNMWISSEDNRIFEVEVEELKEKNDVGVIDKYVCGKFRFIKEVKAIFDKNSNTGDRNTGYSNTGDSNTGYRNTGNSNTGDRNTGDSNTGYRNTGNSNTGDRNTGNRNTGYRNTGYRNTGDRNTGYSNTGYRNTGNSNTGDSNTGDSNTGDSNTGDSNTGNSNTGDRNTGNSNTGDRNTGNRNTGYRNTGYRNTGDWNNSNFNTGFFNTEEVKIIKVFNRDCEKLIWDDCKKPNFIYFEIGEDYKKSFIESFEKANKEDVELLIKLPNFDYNIFFEISGINKKMINKKLI